MIYFENIFTARVESLASAAPPSLPAPLLLRRRLSTLPARPRVAGMATAGRSSQVVWWRREPADRHGISSTSRVGLGDGEGPRPRRRRLVAGWEQGVGGRRLLLLPSPPLFRRVMRALDPRFLLSGSGAHGRRTPCSNTPVLHPSSGPLRRTGGRRA
jgi:hypothetical protein